MADRDNDLASVLGTVVTEDVFAQDEERIGKDVHSHDGVWWVKADTFYCKPVNEFRPLVPGTARPHPMKSILGYSHQVPETSSATRWVRWNVLHGEELRAFSLERLPQKKRNNVRGGLRGCRIELLRPTDLILGQMRAINVSQAKRLDRMGERKTYLPHSYYESKGEGWRGQILGHFQHRGHKFLGAFVGEALAAYVDLVQIEDTWMFGAVKSADEHLRFRPVDALYFTILSEASRGACSRVLNGGGEDERGSLAYFKEQFLLKPVTFPYYTRTLLPVEKLRGLKELRTRWSIDSPFRRR